MTAAAPPVSGARGVSRCLRCYGRCQWTHLFP